MDGTPVYDIKPYLPFDGVPHVSNANDNSGDALLKDKKNHDSILRTPSWVIEDGELSSVQWTNGARESLHRCRADGLLEPFYPAFEASGTRTKQIGSLKEEGNDDAMLAISEVIGQDPRARHEGRGGITCGDSAYEISFCNLRVFFKVGLQATSSTSINPSADHHATVTQVIPDRGDAEARPGSYQHNLAMRRRAEELMATVNVKNTSSSPSSSSSSSRNKSCWLHPVREGLSEKLYMLRDGSMWSFDVNK